MPRSVHLLLALVLVAACDRPGDTAARDRALAGRALKGALAYPKSSLVSLSAGDEAAQLVFTSMASVADVAQWYRIALQANGWEIQSDKAGQGGELTIYATQGERPIWITLRPNTGAPGTTYTLMGAVIDDSTKAAPPAR